MKCKILKNEGQDSLGHSSSYFLEVRMNDHRLELPVYWRQNTHPHPLLKELYRVELAGIVIEKGNLPSLLESAQGALKSMLKKSTLPEYIFTWESSDEIVAPVYHFGKEYQTSLSSGPRFSGGDVGALWGRLADHLVKTGKIKRLEQLMVYWVSPKSLALVDAEYVFFHRNDFEVLVPVFVEFPEAPKRWFAHVEGDFLDIGIGGFSESLKLHALVAQALFRRGHLRSPEDLKIRWVSESLRNRFEKELQREPAGLACYEESGKRVFPIFRYGETYLTLIPYTFPGRYMIIFGKEPQQLRQFVGAELAYRKEVSSPEAVLLE